MCAPCTRTRTQCGPSWSACRRTWRARPPGYRPASNRQPGWQEKSKWTAPTSQCWQLFCWQITCVLSSQQHCISSDLVLLLVRTVQMCSGTNKAALASKHKTRGSAACTHVAPTGHVSTITMPVAVRFQTSIEKAAYSIVCGAHSRSDRVCRLYALASDHIEARAPTLRRRRAQQHIRRCSKRTSKNLWQSATLELRR